MIIGCSGKIGSGKDEIGKIIQYLTSDSYDIMPYNDWLLFQANNSSKPPFIIKRFAGKVKEICSILTGIPIEDFEKQEVKDRVLGEEWTRYGYADGFSHVYHNGEKETIMNNKQCDKERYELELKTNWQTAYKHQYTVREILQLVGTDAMRNVIHENVWVNALFSDYKPQDAPYKYLGDLLEDKHHKVLNNPNWIITDTRFPNEAEAIKSRGGLLIRVNRINSTPQDGHTYVNKQARTHPSETALDNYNGFDEVIDNNGTIEELIEKVKLILIKHKII